LLEISAKFVMMIAVHIYFPCLKN